MNQTQISEKVKISQQYLSMIINGKRRPSWPVAKRLAKLFGTDPTVWLEAAPDVMAEIIKSSIEHKKTELPDLNNK